MKKYLPSHMLQCLPPMHLMCTLRNEVSSASSRREKSHHYTSHRLKCLLGSKLDPCPTNELTSWAKFFLDKQLSQLCVCCSTIENPPTARVYLSLLYGCPRLNSVWAEEATFFRSWVASNVWILFGNADSTRVVVLFPLFYIVFYLTSLMDAWIEYGISCAYVE